MDRTKSNFQTFWSTAQLILQILKKMFHIPSSNGSLNFLQTFLTPDSTVWWCDFMPLWYWFTPKWHRFVPNSMNSCLFRFIITDSELQQGTHCHSLTMMILIFFSSFFFTSFSQSLTLTLDQQEERMSNYSLNKHQKCCNNPLVGLITHFEL